MRNIWKLVYIAGAVYCVLGGYLSLNSSRTANTNADWVFVTISFIFGCFFPVVAMAYSSRRFGVEIFRRPSLDRHPIGWWRDTLQPLRVTLISILLFAVGACFALPHADHKGVMIFWFYAALSLGLFLGERLVYRIYAQRIV